MKKILIIILLLSLITFSFSQKPNIWLITDFTGIKIDEPIWNDKNESMLHFNTQSDADDYCAISMYLMHANKFNTERIVLASDGSYAGKSTNALQEFKKWFVPAYQHDVKYWNSEDGIGGYPSAESIESVIRGASTQGKSYDPDKSYKNLNELPLTVKELVDELKKQKYSIENPLFVMVWGPLTEVAMAIKHLQETNNSEALSRLFIITHWTTSYINLHGESHCVKDSLDKIRYGVANCNEDCRACWFVHSKALKNDATFRFIDLGAIGQDGIVAGSIPYFAPQGFQHPKVKEFMKSKLGKLFITSNFVYNRPDGSDAATFYTLLGTYGVKLSDFNDNGQLTKEHEEKGIATFQSQTRYMLDELLAISNIVANNKKTLEPKDLNYPLIFKAGNNPLVKHIRTADPDCNVWEDGRLWMYTSQDHDPTEESIKKAGHGYAKMDGYHVYSTTDLYNWIDHGEILHSKDVDWGTDDNGWMWAPGAAYKDGMYYLYYPHHDKEHKFRVGVAKSKFPQGPFTDIGKYIEGTHGIDPKCFIDDDGTAYLYFDHHVAKLKPNMIELEEEAQVIDYGANDKEETNEDMVEAPWIFKKDGKYYFSYSNYRNKKYQGFYGIGDKPHGPFKWKGAVNPRVPGAQDHHSIIQFKNNWYYFYHVGNYTDAWGNKGKGNRRNVCLDNLHFKEDGTMKIVEQTKEGVKPVD